MSSPSLSFSHLSFAWPGGDHVLTDVSGAVSTGLTAIVGANGAGKSTLLGLLAGEHKPGGGHVLTNASVRYVPQDVALGGFHAAADAVAGLTVADALGVAGTIAGLRAIESGSVDPAHYDAVGDDWDVEARADATLASIGLMGIDLSRTVAQVSGGEATQLVSASALMARPDVLLLDEPTNNLDGPAKEAVTRALIARTGATLVVTHDRDLLELVGDIGELRRHGLRWCGGNIDHYERVLAGEAEAAQQTLARVTGVHEERLASTRVDLDAAQDAVDEDKVIRVDLPDTRVPPRKDVVTVEAARLRTGVEVNLVVQGPERIALVGRNGAGKTTMLCAITGESPPLSGRAVAHVPLGYLPQRLDVLDDALIEALGGYQGALMVVSHDRDFIGSIGVTRTVDVTGAEVHDDA